MSLNTATIHFKCPGRHGIARLAKPNEFDLKKSVLTTQEEKQLLSKMWKLAKIPNP
jgi:hypothetical protein